MEKENLLKELSILFQEVLKDSSIELTSETTAHDVDNWTSLNNMLLINTIEQKYDIHFAFREIIKLKNVGDLADSILKKANKA